MPEKKPTLLLSANDVVTLLDMPECIRAVENGLLALGQNRVPPPQLLSLHSEEGGLHVKAAAWNGQTKYFVAKANANFPENRSKHDLPTIQGVIILSDATTGELLALIDSIEITAQRTAAATAVAAKYLARRDSRVLAICGCGRQGMMHLRALLSVLPIKTVHAFDTDPSMSIRFVERVAGEFAVDVQAIADVRGALSGADVIATCTPSRQFFIRAEDVRDGSFVAAVGADNEHKQEIDPRLFAASKIAVDSLAQCSTIGDLHHALAAGTVTKESVHAELAQIVAGQKPGRTSEEEITLFDSTGIAIEDAAAAVYVFEKATRKKKTTTFRF